MPITLACPKCASKLSVPDSASGKKLRCPRCGEVFRVGLEASPTAHVTTAPTTKSAIESPLKAPPPPFWAEEALDDDDAAPPRRRRGDAPDIRLRRRGSKAFNILSPKDYSNYRNVRAVSVLFVVLGVIFLLAGVAVLMGANSNPRDRANPLIATVVIILGICGTVGGIAAFRGKRQWSWMAYVMGVAYLFAFPLGTILSAVMLMGLSRYLRDVERVRPWKDEWEEDD